MIQLIGTLETIAGGAPEIGSVILQLHGYGSQVPRVSGTAILARTTAITVAINPVTGAFAVPVFGNDVITPAGTYYTLKVLDSNGGVAQIAAYVITGGGTLDLSSAPTFDPTGGAPPAYVPVIVPQVVVMSWTATPVFDGSLGLSFELPLTGNVTGSTFIHGVPGNLYTFNFTQDGVGGRVWTPPGNVHNASPVSPVANSITTQTFICRSDLSLDAIGGAMFYP